MEANRSRLAARFQKRPSPQSRQHGEEMHSTVPSARLTAGTGSPRVRHICSNSMAPSLPQGAPEAARGEDGADGDAAVSARRDEISSLRFKLLT